MPRGPGGAQIGIVYCALPTADTANVPGVRPTAASASMLAMVAATVIKSARRRILIGSSSFRWIRE
jgi:hypothetical protein